MNKLIGAGLIIGVTSVAGFGYAQRYTERCHLLQIWLNILEVLKTEICHQAQMLPEVFRIVALITHESTLSLAFTKLADRTGYGSMLGLYDAWQELLIETSARILTNEDLAVLEDLGEYLGSTDREDQYAKITTARARLEYNLRNAESDRDKKVRLYRYLGFAIGAALVLWTV